MLPDDVSCPECGAVSAAGARLCGTCGAPLADPPIGDGPTRAFEPPAALTERPTEQLPIQPLPAAPPPTIGHANFPPDTPPPLARPRRRRLRGRLGWFAAGAALVALIFAAVFVMAELVEVLGGPTGELPASPRGGGAGTAPPAGETAAPTGVAGSCAPQQLQAPADGAWRMARRGGDLQLARQGSATRLTLRIYDDGSADGAALVSAEDLPAAEVESRYGITPPNGAQRAVVVSFSPEFRISGRRYELGRAGSVDGVVVERHDSGVVAVAGVSGGCFALGASGWEVDGGSAEVFVDFDR